MNIGPALARKITTNNKDPTQSITSSPTCSFYLSPITEAQVFTLFSSLNENKTSLNIPNKLIKLASEPLSKPFTVIYNESVLTGKVPELFKISKITPIFKSGIVTELGNYRPIAVISPFSKVLERLVYQQLVSFLEKQCLLFNFQFGFRKGYSTEYAILETLENLKSAIDDGKITCAVFLDFSKAFDTINHQILLDKLYKYVIRGLPHAWFSSYITNRKQFVKVGNTESSLKTITCGVPQGSTLGPLLFLLYINDLPESSKKLIFRIFADDTNIFYSSKDPEQLQRVINEELGNVLKYCTANKLSINFKKTHYMLITSPRKKVDVQVSACDIEQKSQIKYLGVFIDDCLKWDAQLQYINNKITKNIGILYKLRYYVSMNTLKQLYYTLIYPYLNYGLMSWGTACQTRLKKMKTSHNNCLRCIFFADKRENATPYFALLDILKLENIFKLKIGSLVHKLRYNKQETPPALHGLVSLASDVHKHNTRFATSQNLYRPYSRTNYGLARFKVVASQTWETIPTVVKCVPYNAFKKKYKLFLLDNQT